MSQPGVRTLCLFALLAGCLAAPPAFGMTVVKRDFPDLVARAEQIVVGTVTAVRETEEPAGVAVTLVTFSDLTVLKGDVGSEFTLRLSGGGSGRYVVEIPDMPHFSVGERAVLFVAGNGRDICPLVGVWQGRFRVRFAETAGQEIIEGNDGKPVVGLAGRELQFATPSGDGGAAVPMTLDAFRELITGELAAPHATTGASR